MRLASVIIFNFFGIVSAATYNVTVGNGGQLAYGPTSLTGVNAGDVIRFQFTSTSPHSVTESTFDQPCVSKPQGRDSGMLTSASPTPEYSLTVDNVTSPLWFHCVVSTHCSGAGMVFAVNPTTEQSFAAFQAKATGKTLATTTSSATTTPTLTTPSTKPTTGSGYGPSPSSAEDKGPIQKLVTALASTVFLIGLTL